MVEGAGDGARVEIEGEGGEVVADCEEDFGGEGGVG